MQSIPLLSRFGEAVFDCREGTNDQSAAQSCFVEDEYGVIDLGLKPGAVAIDIGAHIGGVTLLLARMGLEVYAYEPVRENYALLWTNVTRNGCNRQVHCFKEAVGDKKGTARIFLHPQDVCHHYIGDLYANTDESQAVDMVGLNDVFLENGIARCSLLKIDAEGAEFPILSGASEDTLRRIDFIYGEYHTVRAPVKTRALLLAETRGLFEDVTEGPDVEGLGHFRFKRRL